MGPITLTTDFGTRDGYVGAVKGVIASRAPGAAILDIAHDIPRWDIAAGAYALAVAAPHYPPGTIHVVVIDPGVGGARKAVIARDDHHYYVAPDNGVLTLACPNPREIHEITAPAFSRPEVSATFHGRDVFAPAAAALATGALPADAGPPLATLAPLDLPPAVAGSARIIHIDHFGNLITDMPPHSKLASARFELRGHATEGLVTTFESVDRGVLCAYVGSAGTLEMGVREGSAEAVIGARRGDLIAISDRGGG